MKKEKSARPRTPMRVVCTTGILLFVAAVFVAIYMMYHNMGQVPGIDFGPGQYYYTDIPGWQKYIHMTIRFLWGFSLPCFLPGDF